MPFSSISFHLDFPVSGSSPTLSNPITWFGYPATLHLLHSCIFFGGFDASADIVVDNGLDLQDLPIIYVTPIREGDATCILYVDWNIIGSILR